MNNDTEVRQMIEELRRCGMPKDSLIYDLCQRAAALLARMEKPKDAT